MACSAVSCGDVAQQGGVVVDDRPDETASLRPPKPENADPMPGVGGGCGELMKRTEPHRQPPPPTTLQHMVDRALRVPFSRHAEFTPRTGSGALLPQPPAGPPGQRVPTLRRTPSRVRLRLIHPV